MENIRKTITSDKVIFLQKKDLSEMALVSYANDFAKQLGFELEEKSKIIQNMISSESFDEALAYFKHCFARNVCVY